MPDTSTPFEPGAMAAPNADAVYRKVLGRILPLLVVVYIIAYIDRSNVGFAKLGFMADLGFTDAIFGVGAGLFYAGYILFEVPSNLLVARFGFRLTLVRIMVLWGVCSALLAFMNSPTTYYIGRFLLGVSEAGLAPGVFLYLTYWTPISRRTRFTAVFMAALPLSGIIGGPLAGFIMHSMDGWHGLQDWQWLFLIEALPGPIFAVVVYKVLCDKPALASWLTPAEKQLIERDLQADQQNTEGKTHKSFLDALKSPRFYLLVGMGLALVASASNVSFWLPTIIKNAGVHNIASIGILSALPYVAGILGQLAIARSADKRNERRWHAASCALISAIGWCVLPLVKTDAVLSVLTLTVTAAGTYATMPAYWTLPSLYLGKYAAAGGIALISALAGSGSVFSPMIIGWLNDTTHSLAAGQYYISALLVIGAVTVIAIGPHAKPLKKQSQAS